MIGIETLQGSSGAAVTVGLVFTEALALYVSYGALTQTVGELVLDAIRGN